jgi:hypothetical protein
VTAVDSPARAEPWRRALFAALLLLTFLLGCFPMADFDVWWHLRTGQLILETGTIPRVDFLTYTNAGRPWIDLYWLFQVGIAVLYRLGGASALVLLKALSGVAIVLAALRSRGEGNKAWPAAAVWLPALIVLSGRLRERPELFSLLFLAGFLCVLARAAECPRSLWLLPLMQVLWVNCHGFFVLGPLVLAAYFFELLVEKRWPPQTPRRRPPTKSLALASLASVLACLASPYGWRAASLPLEQFGKVASSGIYRANIGELRTVGDFLAIAGANNPYLISHLLVMALGLTSFVWLTRYGRISLYRLLLFVAAAYLGWQATRNSALFAVVAAFVTTWNLDEIVRLRWAPAAVTATHATTTVARRRGSSSTSVPAVAKSRRKRSKPKTPRKPSRSAAAAVEVMRTAPGMDRAKPTSNWNLAMILALTALAVATLSGDFYRWAGEGRTVGLGERRDWYAHDACTFLARPDSPERIVAMNISQAAVCIAHAAPMHKLFMDPRLEVNSQETFERYLEGLRKLWRGETDWETPFGFDYARPTEIPALLIERGVLNRAAQVLSHDPRWRCVFADSVATVFVTSAFARTHELSEVRL